MCKVYILRSVQTGKYYVGSTNNLERRLLEHDCNKTRSLINKGPFQLVYQEECRNRLTAYRRELQIKSYKGGKAFKKLISSE